MVWVLFNICRTQTFVIVKILILWLFFALMDWRPVTVQSWLFFWLITAGINYNIKDVAVNRLLLWATKKRETQHATLYRWKYCLEKKIKFQLLLIFFMLRWLYMQVNTGIKAYKNIASMHCVEHPSPGHLGIQTRNPTSYYSIVAQVIPDFYLTSAIFSYFNVK